MSDESNDSLYTILIDYSGTQYNGSEIPWEKINTEPLSFYDKQKFKLPFPLSDPRAMSGGKAMALAEYFQEQGSVFRFQQRNQLVHPPVSTSGRQRAVSPAVSQSNTSMSEHEASARPPATASVASTSGSAVTHAHPIPSASTEGSEDTATPMANATAPTIGLTSGSECALTSVDATAIGSTGGSNAATTPVATSSIESTPEVECAITPVAVPYPLMPGSTSTATSQAAPASPAPPMPSTLGTGSGDAAITPIAAGSIELTSGVERAVTSVAVSHPSTLGTTSTATGQAA